MSLGYARRPALIVPLNHQTHRYDKMLPMTIGRPVTIVIRNKGSQIEVDGPSTFLGGYPVPFGGEQDGSFGEWRWDGRTLHAHTDRLGMYPLFYSQLPDGIAVSTSISELIRAGAPADIDWVALKLLLRMGFAIGCDTMFQSIKTFPVGGKLTWTAGSLEITECYPEIRPNSLLRREAMDAYLDLFRASIRKRIVEGAPIRLPLSGGRDSRHILLELIELGSPPVCCYTSSYSTMSNDVKIARQLCAAVGVPHAITRTPENEDIVQTEKEKNELISFQALEHGWAWLVAKAMTDPQAVTYDGVAGDVLSAGHFHDDENSRLYRAGRFDELARRLAPDIPLVLLPKPLREVANAVDPYPALIKELLRYRDTQNPMMFFFLYNRSRRGVSVSFHRLWGTVVKAVYLPFLDKDIFDFLIGLPEEMFADKTFHTEAILRAYPKVSEIPFAKKTPIPSELQRRYAKQGFRFALGASSPLIDRAALLPRMARALVGRKYEAEANWLVHQAVMLHQLGQLQTGKN